MKYVIERHNNYLTKITLQKGINFYIAEWSLSKTDALVFNYGIILGIYFILQKFSIDISSIRIGEL